MSEAKQRINAILQRAGGDYDVPNAVAQLFTLVGAQLLDQVEQISRLEALVNRQGQAIIRLTRAIDRGNGVHGA